MNILLSNDDGYQAAGLQALLDTFNKSPQDYTKITAVAPEINRSGASNSLTLDQPLRLKKRSESLHSTLYSVNGTPADCVHLALTGLLDEQPQMVISGINHGANMGDDVLYSGTVAAAMEGRFLGLPAMAISINSHEPEYFSTATKALTTLLGYIEHCPKDPDILLNINIPDIPWSDVKGFQSTRLGRRHQAEPIVRSKDARNNTIYWIGPVGEEQDAGEGTDFHAVRNGYISVTPIHIDLTRYQALDATRDWLKDIK